MALIYPNIVPENDLRLPDALTVKHGPAQLLSRLIIEGDKAARAIGLRLRIRHDFDRLVELSDRHARPGDWYRLPRMVNPEFTDMTPENAFWICGEDESGEVGVTWATRIYNWTGTNLAEQASAMWYGRDLGLPSLVTAEAAGFITGVVQVGCASWVRPDLRKLHLSRLIPRIGKAYACARWPIDWSFCYVTKAHAESGLADSYGLRHLGYSVFYPGSPWGEIVIAYSSIGEVYEDMANFLMSELSEPEFAEDVAMPGSRSLEHIVTKTSSEPVFHGRSNLS